MPLSVILLSATSLTPAQADCTPSSNGNDVTCSGAVAPIIHNSSDNKIVNVTVDRLTSDMSDVGSNSDYIIVEETSGLASEDNDFKATDVGDTDGKEYTYGKAASGLSALDQSTSLSLGDGFSLLSTKGAIRHHSTGADGNTGAESRGGGSTHRGQYGGDGGAAGTLTVTAFGNPVSGKGAIVSGRVGSVFNFETTGGKGGIGGEGYHDDIFHNGYGGFGGVGGKGGDVAVAFKDGTSLVTVIDSTGDHDGLHIVSTGGDGGLGGEGKSGASGYGGYGGLGGDGGAITFSATSKDNSITTNAGHGVVIASKGGRGGGGGKGTGGGAHAGDGGAGGNGGAVTVTYSGAVKTTGDEQFGLIIQSAGGANGATGDTGGAAFHSHNGSPSDPGKGGAVALTLITTSVETEGTASFGVVVQSVGGFAPTAGSSSGFSGYGADGGSGGAGGQATMTLGGSTITTAGEYGIGVIVQSIGGGGGVGGSASGISALGGSGGAGGVAGAVAATVTSTTITTAGTAASGILALSVGGGGGASGGADGVVANGAEAGKGGSGGAVTVALDGATVSTAKDTSLGLYAASIGAGGGISHSPSGVVALGQTGGDGGDGGEVTLTTSGEGASITTQGDNSDGTLLQSIGGGGGKGGNTFKLEIVSTSKLGSTGGGGGHGGEISFTGSDKDSIETAGSNSKGFVAQSIGGGGGDGGTVTTVTLLNSGDDTGVGGAASTGGDGGYVHGSLAGAIEATGENATGVLLQSVGGGGGAAGTHVTATVGVTVEHDVGSDGGAGGNGGKVNLQSSTKITTAGNGADGILAQSVGGGGGASSTVVDGTLGADDSIFGLSQNNGATAGAGGDSEDVSVTSTGLITTKGGNAKGLVAQSIAGGGGKSGVVVNGTIGTGVSSSTGSDGGDGGTAGSVEATNSGGITTTGQQGIGLLVQSIGGGGGDSSVMVEGEITGGSLSFNHGGSGGSGGSGGTVTATNNGVISTSGAMAYGLLAQSIGGAGGSGGMVVHGGISVANVDVNIGGGGADGGTSGTVTVTNNDSVMTTGDKSSAIVAQSIGGQGGAGGSVASGTANAGEITGSVSVSIGGDGGKGGISDAVKVTNTKQVTTSGYRSAGVLVQSIGGDGGEGGAVYAGTLEGSSEGSLEVNVAIGGDGGKGGKTGSVEVDNSGDIATSGHFSSAIYAQSIGGNGGNGGSSYAGIAEIGKPTGLESNTTVGGDGGDGAVGNSVTVTNSASLTTTGGNAHAIYAQSVGGNGGDGGMGVALLADFTWSDEDYTSIKANVNIGGGGGSGMNAGAVTLTNTGVISTAQDTSYGIFAQSVGGGGGDGGNAGAYSLAVPHLPDADEAQEDKKKDEEDSDEKAENKGFNASFTLGGSGAAAGDGNKVNVGNSKTIETKGTASYAIFAQSVGGGGGVGGNGEPGLEGWVADIYDYYEKFNTAVEAWEELDKLSQGKLEDVFREGFSVDIGGSGGAGGDGGDVDVSNDGLLSTTGADGTAIVAQSVGGGGGLGGDGSGGLLNSATVAGFGSGGGAGGDITVSNTGTIQTTGDRALGIFAQSVGGGGGASGDLESSIVKDIASLGTDIGAKVITSEITGAGGAGGDVSIDVATGGVIQTTGDTAHGIFVQSVGGGGGGAMTYSFDGADFVTEQAKLGSGNDWGDSGVVTVTVDGSVNVSGDNAVGIFAQSAAGGDGDSYSKGIVVDISGEVVASGKTSRALLVQADESGTSFDSKDPSGGVAQVTIAKGGKVKATNSDQYEAIGFLSGREVIDSNNVIQQSNILTNHGEIFSSTYAVVTDGKSAFRFVNDGTLYGRLSVQDSGTAQSAISNLAGGEMFLGESYLGTNSHSTFQNAGTIKPGWLKDIRTVTIRSSGTFSQTDSGIMSFDTDLSQTVQSGKFILNFDKGGTIDGILTANWIGSDAVKSGTSGTLDVLELNAASGSSFDTSGLGTTSGTAVAYSLDKSDDGSKIGLNYTVDYSGAASGGALSRSASSFGTYFAKAIDAIDEAKPGTQAELQALGVRALNAGSAEELAAVYEEHIVNEAGNGITRAHAAGHAVHGLLQSCPELDPSDPGGFYRQQECVWAQAIGAVAHQDATDTQPSYDESAVGIATAAQFEVMDDVFLEVGGQYEDVNIDGSNFSQDGYRLGAGFALKRELGLFTFSGSFAGGFYDYDSVRSYTGAGGAQTASSDLTGQYLSAEARVYAVLEQGGIYAKPSAAISVTQMWQDAYRETGSGGLNWQIDAISHTSAMFRPSLEIGKAFAWQNGAAVAYLRAGLGAQLTNPDIDMTTRLLDASTNLDDLALTVENDGFEVNLAAGLNAEINDRVTFSLQGQSTLAPSASALGGFARMNIRF